MSLHGELKRSSACCRPAGCIVSKNSNVGFAQELLLSSLIFTSWQNSAGPVLSYADILIWGYLQQLFLSSCVIVSLQFWSLQLCFNTMSKIIPGLDVPPNSSHLSLSGCMIGSFGTLGWSHLFYHLPTAHTSGHAHTCLRKRFCLGTSNQL